MRSFSFWPASADVTSVTILVVIGSIIGGWGLLSVLGNERQDRINRMLLEKQNRAKDINRAP